MEPALICLFAIILDRFLGERLRVRPIAGFIRLAQRIEAVCYGPSQLGPWPRLLLGVLALLLSLSVLAGMVWVLSTVPYLGSIVDLALLYLALNLNGFADQARTVSGALAAKDLTQAREYLEPMVSYETSSMNEEAISLATIEWVLERGCDHVFGALFWFLLVGAPGLVIYRLVNLLDSLWGYPTPRYRYFGWATARLDDLLNWIPAQLTALSYILLGTRKWAWHNWWQQGFTWNNPKAYTVIAAGAGALGLQLGGSVRYYQRFLARPSLGDGLLPGAPDIQRALNLVYRALGLWTALLLFSGGIHLIWPWAMKF